jgi:CBS domain-containing protein
MNVDHFMSHDVKSCMPADSLTDAAMVMWERDCGFVPVVDAPNGALVGVITDRDICMAVATKHRPMDSIPVGEVMNRQLITCSSTDDVQVAMDRMAAGQVHRMPVVDKKSHIKGVISLNDLVLAAAESSEIRKSSAVSYNDVVKVLKAVSAHRLPAAVAAS